MQKLKANDIIYLTERVLQTLSQNRITTVVEFLQVDIGKLATITKLNLPQILAIRNEMFAKYSAPVKSGSMILERSLLQCRFLSTGIERLDAILEGGIPKGNIIELCGLADSGKTQLCFQLSIKCAKTNSSVLYIDTKGDFSAVRIQKILDASGFSHKEMAAIMCKIQVVRIWTIDTLIELLQNIKQKEIKNLALIILDSLPCLMLQFLGDENKMGLKLLNTFINYSRYLTKELQISLICINIQTRWVDQEMVGFEDDGEMSTTGKETYTERKKRCLGRYWHQIPDLVLLIEKPQNNSVEMGSFQITLTVMKSNYWEAQLKQCTLSVSDLGVT